VFVSAGPGIGLQAPVIFFGLLSIDNAHCPAWIAGPNGKPIAAFFKKFRLELMLVTPFNVDFGSNNALTLQRPAWVDQCFRNRPLKRRGQTLFSRLINPL